jgi:outer membrane protein assembly factor BamB
MLLGLVLLWISCGEAADWPRFRGANGLGVAESSNLPAKFGPRENVVWKVDLPPGHSSPVLSETRIFLTAYESDKLWTYCLDRASGKLLWRREAPRTRLEKVDKRNSPASPSPVTDGKEVVVFFADFGLISYTVDGQERWKTPLGPFNNVYGMGASPILVDDKAVLVCDQGTGSYIAAFGRKDGRQRWRTVRPEAVSGHSTPAVYIPASGPAQILAPSSFQLTAYAANTGEKIWWVQGLPGEMKSGPVLNGGTVFVNGYNTPENEPGRQIKVEPFEAVLAREDANKDDKLALAEVRDAKVKEYFIYLDLNHDGVLDAREWEVFRASMASENALLAIRLISGGRGDLTSSALRWKYQRSIPQLPTTLLYQDVLYMINDGGVLTTLNPETGIALKQGRLRGAVDSYYASPVAADGKVFFASRGGLVSVIKAGGEQELLSVNDLDDEIYATPAIADGRLYVRTRSMLYCFGKE